MDLQKLNGMADWPVPKNPTDICSFLGFTGYYHYFVPNYSKIARPVLIQPDFERHFYLQTDASAYGIGAVLSQERGKGDTPSDKKGKPKLHPVAYYSATFTPAERNYDIYERELLAMMKALAHWRHYLGWTKHPFTILTNHANLQYWKAPRNLNRRTTHWHADLQEYDYEIRYIPGKTNVPPDALSRPPGA